uniref:Uncharacterized protein n=1 Tax=Avena sativa TaxID=4498 RepID=A0ACD5WC65_AVESA
MRGRSRGPCERVVGPSAQPHRTTGVARSDRPQLTLAAASSLQVLRGIAPGSNWAMKEFWGTEVKPGQTASCGAGNESVIRITQVALGETKQRKEDVVLYVKVVNSKFVIGTLRAKSHPHMMCHLIFDKEFELSHSSETASVFFCGYKGFKSDSTEGENEGKNNGNATAKHGGNKDDDFPSSDDMDTYEDDSISSTDNLTIPSFIDVIPKDVSSTYEDVFSSETREYEGTSEKIGKRAAELGQEPDSVKANVAPRSGKKSGRKIGSHVAEPYQSQGSSKMVSENSKSKVKLNKSTGDHVCKPCSRTFVTDMALQAHRSAKHH